MKKIFVFLLAAAVVLGFSVSVFADEDIDTASFLPAAGDAVASGDDPAASPEGEAADRESGDPEYKDDDPEAGPDVPPDIQEETSYYMSMGSWTYTLIHEYTIANRDRAVAFNVLIETPLPDNSLPVYTTLNGEVLSPATASITTDIYGHRRAVYRLDHIDGNQTVTLSQRFIMDVDGLNYTFDRSAVEDYYTPEETAVLNRYLLPENGVNSDDSAVVSFTNRTLDGMTDPYQKARALFSAVNLYLTYDDREVADQDAAAVLARGTANCQGYSNLYVACLRAAGIAARRENGYLYLPQLHTTEEYIDSVNGRIRGNTLRHSWVEFYLPGIGWVMADPTFTYTYEMGGSVQKFVDWSYFAQIDNQRRYISFREGSLGDEMVSFSYDSTGRGIDVAFNGYIQPGAHRAAFNDIEGHWAQAAVSYCVNNGLFNGVSINRFAPDGTMTRAMFVTVIGRLYELQGGSIENAASVSFRDINYNDYYMPYLKWAVANHLVSGYGGGLFGPDDPVTREQMSKIMADFAAMQGININVYEGAYLNFQDASDISSWAHTAVAWCSNSGLITGMPGNNFSPRTYANRAQVATIIQRTAAYFGY